MVRRLILTRHCKSDWGDAAVSDLDRPLNARGKRDAQSLGIWLAKSGYVPELGLSSDSHRTRETWALLSTSFTIQPDIQWHRSLYLAAAQDMLAVLRGAEEAQCALMLGHNPGIARFADMLVHQAPDHPRFRDYPTGATTVIDFAAERWGDVDWRMGRVVEFITPRDL